MRYYSAKVPKLLLRYSSHVSYAAVSFIFEYTSGQMFQCTCNTDKAIRKLHRVTMTLCMYWNIGLIRILGGATSVKT